MSLASLFCLSYFQILQHSAKTFDQLPPSRCGPNFKSLQHVAVGVLIGRDATKGYKINICEDEGVLKFHVGDKVIKIPITDGYRHWLKQIDLRIFAAKKTVVPPDSSK